MQKQVVIVGGGPAGLSAALALAGASEFAVTVLERARYPREKPCAGAIGGRGVRLLRELGAMPTESSVPRIEISRARLVTADADHTVTPGPEGSLGMVIRRDAFDAALAQLAQDRGIRVLQDTHVTGARETAHAVTLETSRGLVRADYVVGADGVGSKIRAHLGNANSVDAQVIEVDSPAEAQEDLGCIRFDMWPHFPGYGWVFPTPREGSNTAGTVTRGIYRMKDAPGPSLLEQFERMTQGTRSISATRRFSERGIRSTKCLHSARIALIGEAAGIDPLTGEGIAQAIEYGILFAKFLRHSVAVGQHLEGWSEALRRSRLGIDLAMRSRLFRPTFAEAQGSALRLLAQSPELLDAGARHFAGLPQHPKTLARALASMTKAAVLHKVSLTPQAKQG